MAVALKFALIIYSIIRVKKPSFMNANSVCYSFYGEPANDMKIFWIVTSLRANRQESKLHLGQESHTLLAFLLLLSGDIELCPGPGMKCQETFIDLQDFLGVKGFSIFHHNIRGLTGKKDLITDMLFNNKVNILSLSETFLSNDVHTSISIGGYSFECKNRRKSGGAIEACVKDRIPYIRREDLECEDLEMMWLEISFKNTKSFLIFVIYRPPDTSKHLCKTFIERITDKLQAIQIENKETIIIGGTNCDYANTEGHQDIKTLFSINGSKQVIKKPIRVNESTSTIIDVILKNSPENIIHTDVITTNLSDHEMIGAIRKKCKHKY